MDVGCHRVGAFQQEGRLLEDARIRFPIVQRGSGHFHLVPARVAFVDAAVVAHVDVAVYGAAGQFLDLGARGIDVLQIDRLTVRVAAQGLLREIEVQAAGQGVSHHERR